MVYLPGRVNSTRSRKLFRLSERRVEISTPQSEAEKKQQAAIEAERARLREQGEADHRAQMAMIKEAADRKERERKMQQDREVAQKRERERLEAIRREQSQKTVDALMDELDRDAVWPPHVSPDERAACEKRMQELGIAVTWETARDVLRTLREIGDISEQMFRELPRSNPQPVASEGFKKSVFDGILNPTGLDMSGVLFNWQGEILKGRK